MVLEREQICRGFCDDRTEPTFEPGTTSLTFTGAHFRMSNVKWPEEVWLNTEEFYVNGLEAKIRGKDWVSKSEYLSFLNYSHFGSLSTFCVSTV